MSETRQAKQFCVSHTIMVKNCPHPSILLTLPTQGMCASSAKRIQLTCTQATAKKNGQEGETHTQHTIRFGLKPDSKGSYNYFTCPSPTLLPSAARENELKTS